MSISTVSINVRDLARSRDFYTTYLRAEVLEESDEQVVLDLVTARAVLRRVDAAEDSPWRPDDLQRGFRHIGFKVADTDRLFARIEADGVPVHLAPLDAEGGVRIAFFFDPDGTLLEFVQGDLQYHEVTDEALVQAEYALGVPERPRFDHVAETVEDFETTQAFYAPLGFTHHGTLEQPADPHGFRIRFLKSGNSVLEIFTYESDTNATPRVPGAPGLDSLRLSGFTPPPGALEPDGALLDPDGLALRAEHGGAEQRQGAER